MQINFYTGYERPANLTSAKSQKNSSFKDLMAKASSKNTVHGSRNIQTAHVSYSPTWREYAKWSESREPINVPSTNGWTEENIQYLKERYQGELSVFERIEALQTMTKMGCITPEEYQKAVGTDKQMVVCDARAATCVSGPLEEGSYSLYPWMQAMPRVDWAEVLKGLPIGKVNTLDDLFDLLDENNRAKISENDARFRG